MYLTNGPVLVILLQGSLFACIFEVQNINKNYKSRDSSARILQNRWCICMQYKYFWHIRLLSWKLTALSKLLLLSSPIYFIKKKSLFFSSLSQNARVVTIDYYEWFYLPSVSLEKDGNKSVGLEKCDNKFRSYIWGSLSINLTLKIKLSFNNTLHLN